MPTEPTTRRTHRLQILVAACSVVFAIGSALHGFVVVDAQLIETMMRMANSPDPAAQAPGFTTGFRIVGGIYVLGNALGVLSWWSRSRLLWWWILAVNLTQGAGYFVVPPEMWTAINDRYGLLGALPSLITDGGAALLALLLVATMVRYRTTWTKQRTPRSLSPA